MARLDDLWWWVCTWLPQIVYLSSSGPVLRVRTHVPLHRHPPTARGGRGGAFQGVLVVMEPFPPMNSVWPLAIDAVVLLSMSEHRAAQPPDTMLSTSHLFANHLLHLLTAPLIVTVLFRTCYCLELALLQCLRHTLTPSVSHNSCQSRMMWSKSSQGDKRMGYNQGSEVQ